MEISSFIKDKVSKKCAVILVDMQETFVKNLRDGEADRIIPKQLEVLNYCNQFDIPVVVLEMRRWEFGETIDVLITEARKNFKFHLIGKVYDDGFESTKLHTHLKKLGIKKVFLMGINADFCVIETARGAIDRGYKIITSKEVISGQSHHSPDNSIGWFSSNGNCLNKVDEFVKAIELN